jgi:fermentation-respiration switch protein FrsA (DUF1100 family)
MAGAADPRARAVAAIAPVISPARLPFEGMADVFTPWLPGFSDDAFSAQWQALGADPKWDAANHAAKIAPRPLLVIHAAHDDDVPLEQGQAVYDAAQEPRRIMIHEDANHAFTWHRDWLRGQLIGWLDGLAL